MDTSQWTRQTNVTPTVSSFSQASHNSNLDRRNIGETASTVVAPSCLFGRNTRASVGSHLPDTYAMNTFESVAPRESYRSTDTRAIPSTPANIANAAAMAHVQLLLRISTVYCYTVIDERYYHLASGRLLLHRIAIPNVNESNAPPLYDIVFLTIGDGLQLPLQHDGRAWQSDQMCWVVPIAGRCSNVHIRFNLQTPQIRIDEWQTLLSRYTIYELDSWSHYEFDEDWLFPTTLLEPLPTYEYVLLEKSFQWRLAGWAGDWLVGTSNTIANRMRQIGDTVGMFAYLMTRQTKQNRSIHARPELHGHQNHHTNHHQVNEHSCLDIESASVESNTSFYISPSTRDYTLAIARQTGQITQAVFSFGHGTLKCISESVFGIQRETIVRFY
ncbi:hypothetical protein BDF19DRAFT_434512 [Syncephalis fuscata]|nr:hypothetical protein BDF19DRAFT_434512 [Syncephalis fuscata]